MVLALISICVVFLSLFVLYVGYEVIGYFFSGKFAALWSKTFCKSKKQEDLEVEAAIATALDLYMNETVHDDESYIITIRRK